MFFFTYRIDGWFSMYQIRNFHGTIVAASKEELRTIVAASEEELRKLYLSPNVANTLSLQGVLLSMNS